MRTVMCVLKDFTASCIVVTKAFRQSHLKINHVCLRSLMYFAPLWIMMSYFDVLCQTHKKKMYCERQLKRLNMKLLHEWQQPALTKLKHGDGKEIGADVTQRKTCRMKL